LASHGCTRSDSAQIWWSLGKERNRAAGTSGRQR
jgi:hypothetical protein